ncbi:MAG: hypothetical protein QM743_01720 [Chitinophagaceae bacterium]
MPALATTHGQSKVEWMAERIRAMNPEITLNAVKNVYVRKRSTRCWMPTQDLD